MDERQRLADIVPVDVENDAREMLAGLGDVLREIRTFAQNRSNFQLEHFVVGQHDMPGRQRHQVLMELEAALFGIADALDQIEIAQDDLAALREIEEPNTRQIVAMRRAERTILRSRLIAEGKMGEVKCLYRLLKKIPEYSREEYEAEEALYWRRRLMRQATLSVKGGATGLGFGNLDALLQIITPVGEEKPQLTGLSEKDVVALGGLPRNTASDLRRIEDAAKRRLASGDGRS